MIDIKTIAERDRSSVLHPFTQLKEFATGKIGDPTTLLGGRELISRMQRAAVILTALLAFTV